MDQSTEILWGENNSSVIFRYDHYVVFFVQEIAVFLRINMWNLLINPGFYLDFISILYLIYLSDLLIPINPPWNRTQKQGYGTTNFLKSSFIG